MHLRLYIPCFLQYCHKLVGCIHRLHWSVVCNLRTSRTKSMLLLPGHKVACYYCKHCDWYMLYTQSLALMMRWEKGLQILVKRQELEWKLEAGLGIGSDK